MDETSTVKTVLITGCSSGIGLCLAHGLRAAGYRVFATARKDKDLTKLKMLGFEAFLAFKENVDSSNSDYKREYKIMIERLNSDKNAQFTLAPESVLQCVLHALESKAPKNHYRVTFPTKLFAFLCRILPSSWIDNILSRVDDGDRD